MSRIHEALIKAQQERKGDSAGTRARSALVSEASVVLQSTPARSAAGLPTIPDVDSSDVGGLLARCSHPAWQTVRQNMLFLGSELDGIPAAEQFRTFRSRLYRIRQKRPLKTILVTSPLPGEGKSFVSGNLSQMLAHQRGCRTLLIDADLRWSRLHDYLGAPAHPGLPDYLAGKVDELAIVQQSPLPDFFFIPGGATQNPAELIGSDRMKTLLDRLAPMFDWIVIDSPPVGVVSDATMLAGLSDGVLLVIRSGCTRFEVAKRAREELKDRPLLGVVLNAAQKNGRLSSYYGENYSGAPGRQKVGKEQGKPKQ